MSNSIFALEASGVDVAYHGNPVLRDLNVQVRRGEIYALLGGNGAGKSTTLNTLLGFARPDAGSVRVCGIDVAADVLGARAQLAYVPENVALYEHLDARENIEYFLRLANTASTDDQIADALRAVRLDESAWKRRLGGYSKGMRQKVAIALAVARAVPVLLLDEPTSGLDPQATSEFNALLQTMRANGAAIFMVTHDLLGAAEVADRIGFLDRGHIGHESAASGADRFDVRDLYQRYAGAREAA
ncbi:ABC transporter ATP-binding protein [Massilia eurypsychrophila]|jgi:ABC-2 type transport system ATP-binding protein|uniref:ABC transporter ATP-binding protein n=1 Tax=Massilia eurypsychrophila TaxID=1485217 RepID=A0A2G8TBP6_9BURK|nr:ABC transporter ATP-binding protein [Massilia eurypsychrophila]PIL43403.1 ABC transporter ATP-binding protein [Massilia eurypsychrophila]